MSGRRAGLVRARESAGFTQERLAEVAGVSRETVVRWEAGANAPSVYLRPKLARLLGRTQRELEDLIHPSPVAAQVSADIEAACEWLDVHAGWRVGTARDRLASSLRADELAKARARDAKRGTVPRAHIVAALSDYYGDTAGWCVADCEGSSIPLALASRDSWLDLGALLNHEADRFRLVSRTVDDTVHLDAVGAKFAVRRLVEAVALDVAIVNSPLFRMAEFAVDDGRLVGALAAVPFFQYALTSDLLETELADRLVGGYEVGEELPLRSRYLASASSLFDWSGRSCSGGVLALCAIARPADPNRGPADFVLLAQERGRRVLNGVGRLSVIPRGFHQPMTDWRVDASIGATLRRELEEELFLRDDVDNTVSVGRVADPMHPNRLSEPMRWLMSEPGRLRLECTGVGVNVVNGNYEIACLAVTDDPEFWVRFGDRIEANWESDGLRQYSTLDRDGVQELIFDDAWSSEGLFALIQGLRRLSELDDKRTDLPAVAMTTLA